MDFRLALIATLLVGTAVGLAVPGGPLDKQAEAGAGEEPEALLSVAAAQASTSAWEEDVLMRDQDGHFYADVRVDGNSYRMLVDTGATVVALTGADAEAMGLDWREEDVRPVAQGASGPVSGVHATIPNLALGNHEVSGVPALIIPEGLEISLLGQSFLGTIGSVRISGDQMVLGS
jgi:aspartyl protease family protein